MVSVISAHVLNCELFLRIFILFVVSNLFFEEKKKEKSKIQNFIIFLPSFRYDMCRRRKGGRCTKGTAGMFEIFEFLCVCIVPCK